jgi:MFS family permease
MTERERRRGLVAAIASVTVFGLSIGEGAPLMSLLLEARGTDATLNGFNAASAFLGVLVGPLLAPRWVRWVGLRNLLLACFALDILVFMLVKVFAGLGAWFVLRIMLGLIGSTIFTASEASINLLAGDARRGRIIGIYAAALSAGFALGPLLLAMTGIAGWAPFIANGAITACAMLPLLGLGDLGRELGRRGVRLIGVVWRAPLIVCAVGLFGLYEAAMLTLLPIWGVRRGLDAGAAAATVSVVYVGAIVLQIPIGWLSDHLPRPVVLRLCGFVGLAGAVLLVAATTSGAVLYALLFVWGGVASGIYPLALGMAGDRFRGHELVTANAAMIMAYGLGALLGPPLGGAAMDAWNPQGLPGALALLFACFLLATITFGRTGRKTAAATRLP